MSPRSTRRHAFRVSATLALALVAGHARAQSLTTAFTYQGAITAAGAPATGNYDLRFRLYDAITSGNQIGSTLCADNVAVTEGRFTTSLDFGSVFVGQERYLEIEVRQDTGLSCANIAGFTILGPRQRLAATPNALFALTANAATNTTQLNGQSAAYYLNAANLNAGSIPSARLAGTYSNTMIFNNASNIYAGSGASLTSLNASNVTSGSLADARLSGNVDFLNTAQTISATKAFAVAPSFTAAGTPFTVSTNTLVTNLNADLLDGLSASAFLQSIPNPLGLIGSSANHIIRGENTYSGSVGTAGVVGVSSGTSGAVSGVFGTTASTSGDGVTGLATATTGNAWGVHGQTVSTVGHGVYGRAATSTGVNHGVYGESDSNAGIGVYGRDTASSGTTFGGMFENFSASGAGVQGNGSGTGVEGTSGGIAGRGVHGVSTSTSGLTYGGLFEHNSNSGAGVRGVANNATGSARGVEGFSAANSGTGVHGQSIGTTGFAYGTFGESESTNGRGAGGWATASTGSTIGVEGFVDSTTGYGVRGEAGGGAGFGLWANGKSGASGTKSFRIDHPDDPENAYLLHYSIESPDVLNAYSGIIMLDATGEAIVELPSYFAKINREPRYTLTAVGAPMPMLHVATEIDEGVLVSAKAAATTQPAPICTFRIGGGVPNAKVSWRVEAIRSDRWVQTYGAPVESFKVGAEKGTYQHPELYGQPAAKGTFYNPNIQLMTRPATSE